MKRINAYIIAHAPFFLPAQYAGLSRAFGECDITVVAARHMGKRMPVAAKVLQSPAHGLLPILDWLYEQASDGPSIFMEYDVIPVAPLFGNWMNKRGIQERGQTEPMPGLWPSAFGWERKSDFRREFFKDLGSPFHTEWAQVVQDRAAVRGGLPACAEECDFRMIGNSMIHYVNGSGRMTNSRNACFSECLRGFGINWRGPDSWQDQAAIRSGSAVTSGASSFGPGAELKKLLARVGIKATPNCSCNRRAREMDARGCDWCEQNLDAIVGWLREEATKRKLPFLDAAGRLLIRRAIRNARNAMT